MNNTFINKNHNNLKSEKLDWSLIQADMKNKLGQDIYESWLKKIDFVDELNNYVLLSVPTRFIRDWITSRYLDQILHTIRNYKKEIIRIEFKIIEVNKNNHVESVLENNQKMYLLLKTHIYYIIELTLIKDLKIFLLAQVTNLLMKLL